jgi:hypothetical protein
MTASRPSLTVPAARSFGMYWPWRLLRWLYARIYSVQAPVAVKSKGQDAEWLLGTGAKQGCKLECQLLKWPGCKRLGCVNNAHLGCRFKRLFD